MLQNRNVFVLYLKKSIEHVVSFFNSQIYCIAYSRVHRWQCSRISIAVLYCSKTKNLIIKRDEYTDRQIYTELSYKNKYTNNILLIYAKTESG
jgi:hypothetical protein